MVDSIEREKMIALIVAGLQDTARFGHGRPGGACPYAYYSQPIQPAKRVPTNASAMTPTRATLQGLSDAGGSRF